MNIVETEDIPIWRFLLRILRKFGLRAMLKYAFIFLKMGVFWPFGTVTINVFEVDEDNPP